MRITEHPILEFRRGKKVRFYFNNKEFYGYEGETISSALVANGITTLSRSLKYSNPRGFFCGIGKCASCLMTVNGIPNVRTCIAPLQEGLRVTMQDGYADLQEIVYRKRKKKTMETEILVIGGGPAGLSAALKGAENGAKVLLVDENPELGGQLIKQTHKFFGSKEERAGTRGIEIAQQLKREVENHENIEVLLQSTVFGYYECKCNHCFGVVRRNKDYSENLYEVYCKSAIFACGAMENMLAFPGNDLPGVYGAGAVQTLMNVYGVKPGKRVLMVGSGNVGLIVSYQLLQAGVDVACIVEGLPTIGGYHVHAAKVRRCGVPILTSHTVTEAHGKERVEGATIAQLDHSWRILPETKQRIDCDTICLAVGLTPSIRLLSQTGAEIRFIPEACGYVALHNGFMETTVEGIYVAGDSSGIEEASTAMLEGCIAGVAAAHRVKNREVDNRVIKPYQKELERLRAGPFGERGRKAKESIVREWRRRHEGLRTNRSDIHQ